MRTQHFFVPILDVGEVLPFCIKPEKNVQKSIAQQEHARAELERFIDMLEKSFKEKIFYMGMDVIEAKTYERFIFEDGGFLEIMTETPLALIAHFIEEKRAKKFAEALKKALSEYLKGNPTAEMFINSIAASSESDETLTYQKWDMMKSIKK